MNPKRAGDASVRTYDGNGGEAVNVTRLASIDSFDSKWLVQRIILYTTFITSFSVQLILSITLHGQTINCYPWVWLKFCCYLYRQQFLEPGESVLMISLVRKLQKLSSKKVQLILTNKPQLIYVDPAKLEVRGNVAWSDNPNELNVQVMSPSNFKIFTVSHVISILYSFKKKTMKNMINK